MRRTLRALVLLTGSVVQRLLREGLVLRSLVFPIGLTAGTLLAVLALVSVARPSTTVAVPDAGGPLAEALREARFVPVESADPEAAVRANQVWAATDGATLWIGWPGPDALRAEAVLREQVGADWMPDPQAAPPRLETAEQVGMAIVRLLAALFTMYGVVFGAGLVARDRDEGTLEAELSLPIPRWVHGATRWFAATALLATFFGLGVQVFAAIVGLPDPAATIRHGTAATGTAVALGLAAVGRGGLKTGFSSTLAAGMTALGTLFGLGVVMPGTRSWLPVASLLQAEGGWLPVGVSLLLATGAIALFARRSRLG